MDVHTTPAKAQRASHHRGTSAASSTPAKTNNEHGSKSTNRRRNNQNTQNQPQQAPAWDSAGASDLSEGYFDANGRFVGGSQESPAPDESPAPAKGKRGKAKQNQHDNGHGMPQSHMAAAQAMAAGTPAKIAYAGPTFHASPAASALPKPSFMSKSVPGDAKPSTFQSRLEQEMENSGSSTASTPIVAENKPAAVPPPREESPLEFFFKADRAEKSKSQTPNGFNPASHQPNFTRAQSSPGNEWSNIYHTNNGHHHHHQRTDSTNSQRGMFALELDGTGVQPGRSPVAKPQVPHPATASRPSSQMEQDPIRRFLYETANRSSPSPKASPQLPQQSSGYSSDHLEASPFYRPAPPMRSSSGPSTPAPQPQQSNIAPNLHYGNRNLSPLFQAAKSPSGNPPSRLRREVDASSPTHSNPQHQWSSIYQQQPAQHLSPPPDRFNNPGPPNMAPRSQSYGAQPAATHDTKSMEDDLRRILKLTASSGGATGVQG